MIEVSRFVETLKEQGVNFFTGVPDSLLKSFCAYLTDHCGSDHIISANEGGAIGLAAGHYLATGKPALVYMQNSGQGNAVNPLMSLADPEVYSIPMILLVGWRGEPGVKDEPQHVKQGRITIPLFETLEIPTTVLESNEVVALRQLASSVAQAKSENRSVALVVRKGLFSNYELADKNPDLAPLSREEAIEAILTTLGDEAVVVSTTGMISREVYETRARLGQDHSRDFLTVGSMGHALMIALGIARKCNEVNEKRYVVCLDGDGSALMQMGNLAIAGSARQANLIHVVLNNAAHDSVGGQPTVGGVVDFCEIAKACGCFVAAKFANISAEGLRKGLREILDQAIYSWACDPVEDCHTTFVEIDVAKGARNDLGRPKERPHENKKLFMETLAK